MKLTFFNTFINVLLFYGKIPDRAQNYNDEFCCSVCLR